MANVVWLHNEPLFELEELSKKENILIIKLRKLLKNML